MLFVIERNQFPDFHWQVKKAANQYFPSTGG